MARQVILAFVAGALLAAALFWLFWPPTPSEDTRREVAEWLARDCATGFDAATLERYRRDAKEIDRLLRDVFEKGPAPADVAAAESRASLTYRRIQIRLRSGLATGLPVPYDPVLLAQTEENYVQRARTDYINRQRSAALVLARIIGKGGRFVDEVNADPKSPFREEVGVPLPEATSKTAKRP